MDKLIVKNFGPIKNVEIKLNKTTLFIGENGSGKSVLAKLITIFTNYNNLNNDLIFKEIENFKINFITDETIIKLYSSEEHYLELRDGKFFLAQSIRKEFSQYKQEDNKFSIVLDTLIKKKKRTKDEEELIVTLREYLAENKKLNLLLTSQYIPAERNLISLFNKSLSTLLVAEVPLPRFLLQFSSEFEKAGNELKELEFLNVKYVNSDGIDRHKIYFDKTSYVTLEESSSGIQSALPLYLAVKYFSNKHHAIIIEEPEQNLFPKSQKETIQYIIEHTLLDEDNNLFMMTHSPYVLSTLNILLYAYKTGTLNLKTKEKVEKIIPSSQWINPDDFSVYYLENGIARDIKGKTGLISDNEIDNISDEITSEFNELVSIYREYKDDK